MFGMNVLDGIVFIAYFVIVLVIGFLASRKKKETAVDYFLTKGTLTWYVIGFSIIAASISTEQLIGTVGFAYKYGLAVVNWEWLNFIGYSILLWIFIPIYLKKKIVTMPQFLENRFGVSSRTLFSVISILTYVFINLAGVIFSGGFALNKIFGINLYVAIWLLCITAGFFTIYGGLSSVAWTQVFQAILLIGGGMLITYLGLEKVPGGLKAIIGAGERAHLMLPASHPALPWTGMLVLATSTNIWYYCSNQYINQSCLGAKSHWDAKLGIILACFLGLFMTFAHTFPGLIAYAINPNLASADEALPFLIHNLVPIGLKGLVFAGLCAAIMSTIAALVNSTSTLVTLDIYKKFINKNSSEKDLIKFGRICGTVILITGALWAPVVLKFGNIFSYFQECWFFIAAPCAVVFMAGVLWKRANNAGAFWTLCLCIPMFFFPYLLRTLKVGINPFNMAGLVLIFSIIYMVVITLLSSSPKEEKIKDFLWNWSMRKLPEEEVVKGYPLYKHLIIWWSIVVGIFILLYIIFW